MNARMLPAWIAMTLLGCIVPQTAAQGPPAGPTWSWNQPIYETSLDLVTPTGKFREFEDRLDALQDMGVGIIWFLPIFPRGGNPPDKPQSNSAYCVRDYYDVNPEHGTKEEFKHLVAAIHARGMYVILDWVPNHTSWGNSLIKTHTEFYKKDSEGHMVHPGPWTDVAQLDHSNRAVWEYMLAARTYWIKEFGVDGFREDVAGALPREYWQWLRPRLNAVKPVLMLAEDESPAMHPVFDLTYDCTSQAYFYMIARGTWPASALNRFLEKERRLYPAGATRMRHLTNHDMAREQFSWFNREHLDRSEYPYLEKTPLAAKYGGGIRPFAVLCATLPRGRPMIWNGQEWGILSGSPGSTKLGAKDGPWFAFYRALFQAYRRNPALYRGEFAPIGVSRPEAVYAFRRRDGENRAVVVLNLSSSAQRVTLELGDASGAFTEAFTSEARTLAAREDLALEPWGYKVYVSGSEVRLREGTVRVSFEERLGPLEIDRMSLGQGGLSDEPMWDSRIAEIRALRPRLIRLFVQEYFQLLPARGRFHFETLDRSVDAILKAGAKPLMCLCFKPDVLFGRVDQDHVEPDDYEAWRDLIFRLVKHYNDRGAGIRYWEVANEPDLGESGGCPYRFRPESYVRYYRQTAMAIKKADPEALVGGPALASVRSRILPELLNACDGESLPLSFISWHIYSSDPAQIQGTIAYARRLLETHHTLKPELILDEWNMDLQDPPLDPRFQPCYVLEVIWRMKEAGLNWSCYYQIRDYHVRHGQFAPFFSADGAAFMTRWWNRMPQYDGLFDFQNRVRPAFFALKLLARLTGERLRVESSVATIHGFATHDEAYRIDSLLLWNFSDQPVSAELIIDGLPRDMLVRHLVLDALAPSDDENARLHPEPRTHMSKGSHRRKVEFGPYAVKFWSFE